MPCTEHQELRDVSIGPPLLSRPCSGREQTHSLSFPSDPESPLSPVPENVRLADGPGHCKGRVEVKHQNRWYSVCQTGWSLRAAKVVCRQLGCGRAVLTQKRCNKPAQGQRSIWLSQMSCSGREATLQDCPSGPWGKSTCIHDEDTWVECEGNAFASRD